MEFSKVILLVVAVMVVIMGIVPCQALGKRRGYGGEFVFLFSRTFKMECCFVKL